MSPSRSQASEESEPAAVPVVLERASIVRNATSLSMATVLARVFTFGLAIAMGRGLGVNAYGRYGFAAALGTIICPLADFGITPYTAREVARDHTSGDVQAARLARVKAATSLVALGIATAVVALLAPDAGAAAATVVVIGSMLVDGMSSFVYGYFQGRERMDFEARWTAIAALVRSVGGIVCVLAFGALLPVLFWMLAVNAAQFAIAARRFTTTVDPRPPRDRRAQVSAQVSWRSVSAMGLIAIFALVYLRADSVIVGIVVSRHAVGLYVAAYALVTGLQIVPWQVATALTPVFARSHAADRSTFHGAWQDGLRIVMLISLPFALVTSILAEPIMRLFFGASFASAGTALAILVWSSPIWALNMTVAGVMRGAGREMWLAATTGVGMILNLGLNAWAIPTFGIDGAAAVTVSTELGVLLLQAVLVLSRGVAPVPHLPYGRLVLALLALSAVALATQGLPVVAGAVIALLAYGIVVVSSGAVERTELRALYALASPVLPRWLR
jgi:O-antigen/teichoic acid export membrane protein